MERITSRQNDLVQNIAALGADASLRRSQHQCVLEGLKLAREAVRLGYRLDCLCLTEEAQRRFEGQIPVTHAGRCVLVTEAVLDRITTQPSPDGVVSVVTTPQPKSPDYHEARRLVMLCGVQDPVNVGAIIRTAAALGFDGVLTDTACADAFSPRALRAGMGASLSLVPVRCDDPHRTVQELKDAGHTLVASAVCADSVQEAALGCCASLTLLIGSEGRGLEQDLVARCDSVVRIPTTGRVESLNAAAAAAILMWMARPALE